MSEDLNNLDKERLSVLGKIGNLTKQITEFNNSSVKDAQKIAEFDANRLKLAKELRDINIKIQNEQRTLYTQSIKSANSLSSLFSNIRNLEIQRIKTMQDSVGISNIAIVRANELAKINQDISQLGSDDVIEREELQNKFDKEINKLEKQKNISKEIIDNLKKQNVEATVFSKMSDEQINILTSQMEVYDLIKKSIGIAFATLEILTSGFKGFLALSLAGAAKLANKLGEVSEKLGGIRNLSTTAISFFDDNAVSNLESLSKEFGGINNVSTQIQISTSLISKNMGISGDEAATLIGAFSRINGNTKDIALDMIKTTQQFAKQNGLIPAKLLGDLAKNTELFAKYAKDGGDNIIRAAGFAQKLGIELSDIEKIQSSLLDFESSITKELELSAMLGRNINLDRARGLFFAGELEQATKETLKAIGGIEAFNTMDPISKQKTADLLGLQVSELQRMLDTTNKVAANGDLIRESFSNSGEVLNTFLNKSLGFTLNSLSAGVITAGQMITGFQRMGDAYQKVVALAKFLGIQTRLSAMWMGIKRAYQATILALSQRQLVTEKVKLGIQKLSSFFSLTSLKNKIMELGIVKKLIGALTVKKRVESTPGPKALGGGVGSMVGGMTGLLKGAAAMLIIAASIFVLGKALQQFSDVNWSAVMDGLKVMVLFGIVAAVFGKGAKIIGLGALIMLGVAASIFLVASAFDLFASAIVKLTPSIKELAEVGIEKLAGAAGGIALLAGSFYLLAASLAAVAVAGLAALPALTAVAGFSVIAGVAAGIGSGISNVISGNDKDNTMAELLNEIRGLRRELIEGKIGVYMDGVKVHAQLGNVTNKIGVNSYS